MVKGVLIGNPVDKSVSHITHNNIFQRLALDATYEKRKLDLLDFEKEINRIKREDFRWIAVTMPFKEKVISFLDEIHPIARSMGAVNMIDIIDNKWVGYNTDGMGCLNVIEKKRSVHGKRVVILGAGGTAKAIAFEAKRRGANITLVNRSEERGEMLAKAMEIESAKEIPAKYDILIHATSVGMGTEESLVPLKQIRSDALIMDVVYNPFTTRLLKDAVSKGAEVVFGFEMFCELSYLQFEIVFGKEISDKMREINVAVKVAKS